MKKGDIPKWVYSFFMLIMTVVWAGFCVLIIKWTMDNPTDMKILATAGVTGLMGAFITWNSTIVQFWFRKNPTITEETKS